MKVKIGPYTSDLIPVRSWERSYEFWRSKDSFYLDEDKWKWYDKLIFGLFDKLEDLVLPINRWSNSRKRKIKVHVDNYDVWGADHTLAMIIHPVLLKLQEIKHGYPHINDEDVPEHLRSLKTDLSEWTSEDDKKLEAKWEWVLDEMIWAFEQYKAVDDTSQFHHNTDQLEMLFVPYEERPGFNKVEFNYQKDPSKPAYWVDDEGKKKHHERKQNGLRLFAKYYEALWD